MEPSIRLSRGYRAAVGGNRDHWNWNWTIGIGTVDPILAGVPYGGRLSRLPPVFRAYASIHRFPAPWPLRAAMAPWSPVTVGPPWPFGALCAGQSSVNPLGCPSEVARYHHEYRDSPQGGGVQTRLHPSLGHRRSCTSSVWQGAGRRGHFSAGASSYPSMHSGG